MINDAFWRAQAERLYNMLLPIIGKLVLEAVDLTVGDLAELLQHMPSVNWDVISENAAKWAHSYTFDLVSHITSTSQAYLQDTISAWVSSGEPLDTLIEQIEASGYFGTVRSEMIAITEVTRVFFQANLITWEGSGVVDGWAFQTSEDDLVCPICEPLGDQVYALSDTEHFPPQHIRCRCWGKPVIKAELLKWLKV